MRHNRDASGEITPAVPLNRRFSAVEALGSSILGTTWRAIDGADDNRPVIVKQLGPLVSRCSVDVLRMLMRTHETVQGLGMICHFRFTNAPYIARDDIGASALPMTQIGVEALIDRLIALSRVLAHLHDGQVVHGYLKPSNIVVTPDGQLVLTDIGLSPLLELAPADDIVSSACALSPEHFGLVRGGLTPRSDLYSLGLIAWRLLTGHEPIEAPDLTSVLHAHAAQQIAPPSSRCAAPRFIDEIVLRLLAKEPDDRYPSAAALLRDLEHARGRVRAGLHDGPAPSLRAPLVGRDRQLQQMSVTLEDVKNGHLRVTHVEGLAGSGKTSLVTAVGELAEDSGMIFVLGKCRASTDERPYEPLVEAAAALSEQFARLPETKRVWVREVLEEMLGPHADALEKVLPPLRPMLTPTGAQSGQVKAAVLAFFRAIAEAWRPLVLVCDDAQWASAPVLELLAHVATNSRDRGIWIITTRRSENVDLLSFKGDVITCDMLNDNEIRRYVASMGVNDERSLSDFLIKRSRGNPLWMIELVRLLRAQGLLVQTPFGWHVDHSQLDALRLPGQMAEVTVTRLMGLDPATRETLAVAALLGDTFDPALVSQASEQPLHQVLTACSRADGAQLIEPCSAGYMFLHDRIRENAAAQLSPAEQRAAHLVIAESLESLNHVSPFRVAYHYAQAGETTRALPHELSAARLALQAWTYPLAVDLFTRVLNASAADATSRRAAMLGKGEALHALGRFDESADTLQRLLIEVSDPDERTKTVRLLAQALHDGGRLLEAERLLIDELVRLGDAAPTTPLSTAREAAAGLLRLRRRPEVMRTFDDAHHRNVVRLMNMLATTRYFLAQVPSTATHLASFHRAFRLDDCEEVVLVWSAHATVLGTLRFVDDARRYGDAAVSMARRLENRRAEGTALYQYAFGLLCAMLWKDALEVFDEARRVNASSGEIWRANACTFMQTYCLLQLGRGTAASDVHETYRSRWLEMGEASMDLHLETTDLYLSARLETLRGDVGAASATCERAIAESQKTPSPLYRIMALAAAARNAIAAGDLHGALRQLESAFKQMKERAFFQTLISDVPGLLAETQSALYEQTGDKRWRRATLETISAAAWWARLQPQVAPLLWRARARLEIAQGHQRAARQFAKKSLDAARRLEMGHEEGLTLLEIGLAERAWRGPQATPTLTRAEQRLREAGDVLALQRLHGTTRVYARDVEVAPPPTAGSRAIPTVSGAQLAARARRQRLLELLRDIATTLSFDALIDRVVNAATEISGAQRGALLIRRTALPGDERGRPFALIDGKTAEPMLAFGHEMALPQGLVAEAMRCDRPIHVEDAHTRGDLFAPDVEAPRALAVLPLAVGPASLGVLLLDSLQTRALATHDDRELLDTLAGQVALALHNAIAVLALQASHEQTLTEREHRHRQQIRLKTLRSRKNALAAFLGIAAHDLKNPLHAIRLSVDSLRNRAADGDADEQYDAIDYAARRATDLVASYLDTVRITRRRALDLDLGDFDTAALIGEELQFQRRCLSAAKARTLRFEVRLDPVEVTGDAERLRQVVANLLSNGLAFSPPEATLRITSCMTEGEWRFEVEDEGVGVDPRLRRRLFRAFERGGGRRPGSGLGLWIARRIVKAHGGAIGVEDGAGGRGSRFWFTVPVRPQRTASAEPDSTATEETH